MAHNPGLHELGKLLIASGDVDARERLNEGLPTSGLLVIDFVGSDWSTLHPRSGRLERFITPRHWQPFAIIVSYHCGQALLVLSLLS